MNWNMTKKLTSSSLSLAKPPMKIFLQHMLKSKIQSNFTAKSFPKGSYITSQRTYKHIPMTTRMDLFIFLFYYHFIIRRLLEQKGLIIKPSQAKPSQAKSNPTSLPFIIYII